MRPSCPAVRTRIRVLLLALGVALAGCGKPPPAPEEGARAAAEISPSSDWTQWLREFQESYFVEHPAFAAMQGRHEFDGRLPNWSAEGIAREIARLSAAREKTVAFSDAVLPPRQRFERDYMLWQIDTDLFWMRDADAPSRNPMFYTGSLEPSLYLTRPYAPLERRMQAFISYARAIPGAAAQIRANLKMPLPKTYVTLGENSFGGFPAFYRNEVPKVFAEVKNAALHRELQEAIEPAARAMQDLADYFKAHEKDATDDFALGPDRFAAMLRMTERVTTPLAELEAIGRADLERNLAALKAACQEYAKTTAPAACIAKMAADKPAGGPVEGAREQLAGLRQFVIDHDLVTVPGDEQALVAEAPPYQRWNFAYIDIAGPYDRGMPSVYNIAPPDPTWSKADRDAYVPGKADLLFTSVHEVWPGHFLQFLHSNRSSFAFGQTFVGYAFAEGWAHYVEEMMYDAGVGDGTPEIHIGQLSNALLRNVRLLCAIGLHTQGMTVAQCETMFREQAFQDPGNARQQAARGTYDPAFLNYTMGKLMILKLRRDWLAAHGGPSHLKEFHDLFLSYGGPPIPLVREQMLGAKDGALFDAPAPAAAK